MLPHLIEEFRTLPQYRRLLRAMPARGTTLCAGQLPGSSPSVLVAALAEDNPQRVFVLLAESAAAAERLLADLQVLAPAPTRLYPQREALGEEEPHFEIAGERVETLQALVEGRARIVVTTLRATAELTPTPASLSRNRMMLSVGEVEEFGKCVAAVEQLGYQRVPSVRDVAQFAVRGGIIDLYGFGMSAPARIEWWGNDITSIRYFDLDSQRSEQETESVMILPVGTTQRPDESDRRQRQSLFDILPPDSLAVSFGANETPEIERLWQETAHHLDLAERRGEHVEPRESLFLSPDAWVAARQRLGAVRIAPGPGDVNFGLRSPPQIERDIKKLKRLVEAGRVLILCDNEGQIERLEELLADDRASAPATPHRNATIALGSLHGGFGLPELEVLTDHEVFSRARRIRRSRRYRQALRAADEALKPGDYVVHLEHGIGIYRSINTIVVGDGGEIEVAVIEYEGGDRLNVPLYRIDQIERYRPPDSGSGGAPPRLHSLGGKRWLRQRKKTESAIRKMAAELIELYAQRSVAKGFAFPPDGKWQIELESSFLYEDTPDQRRAAEDVKRDMEQAKVMDRLVVGDVGYGKTEVAVRAAFKAVTGGRQAAVLVPTTILAEQHGKTFSERLADFPVRVEVLSRFKSPKQQREVLSRLRSGATDIVIGTHRLLSKDVSFKDLGILIVDEEHRFGVQHKERLKRLKLEVDVMSLTATPIPRTLNQALAGLRDMSLIETPPRDRSPVLTFVEPWDDVLLEEVIARELDRGGQVYFVHNRIETIDTIAQRVERLAPRARSAVAHGQMRELDLDHVMRSFVAGDVDVLVSTMIVESGLDVSNANTMVVNRAEHLGLAQLYQLRGRVGRGHRRAYCYLLVPDDIDQHAEERLQLLEHHTELGSGYRLALRDLEVRGAGNLLGAEQSGHAQNVGMDLYMRMLQEAVRALQGEAHGVRFAPPDVYFDGPAHLPDNYVSDETAKLEFYRRLARVDELSEIASLRAELRDRFGVLPDEADRLLVVAELRFLGSQLGIESIGVRGDIARVSFRSGAVPRMARLTAALDEVQFAAEVRRSFPLSLRLTRLGGLDVGAGLVRALAAALDFEIPPVPEPLRL